MTYFTNSFISDTFSIFLRITNKQSSVVSTRGNTKLNYENLYAKRKRNDYYSYMFLGKFICKNKRVITVTIYFCHNQLFYFEYSLFLY